CSQRLSSVRLALPESNLCEIVRSVNVGADIEGQASVVVDTRRYVRRGIEGLRVVPDDSAPSDREPSSKKRSAEHEMEETALVVIPPTSQDTAGKVSTRRARFNFTSRVLTRTLMSTYGWPVKFFRDVRELVATIRNAIEGEKYTIDGHAIRVCINISKEIDIDWQAAEALVLRYSGVPDAGDYIGTVLRLSKEDLRLCDFVRAPPRESHHSQTPEKTGTKAFMSAEVLSNQPNWPDTVRGPEKYVNGHIFHSAIHDLESFFWVLVYLCLTRAGPGGDHRDPPEDFKARAQLDNIVTCLFTSDDDLVLARNKHDLFQSPKDMQDFIIPHFHPYFQCVSNLVLDWWNILQLAYRTYDALTPAIIHQQVLDILDDAMESLPDPVPSQQMDREDDRRLTDLDSSTGTVPPSWGSSPSHKSELKAGSYKKSSPSPSPSPQKKKARVHDDSLDPLQNCLACHTWSQESLRLLREWCSGGATGDVNSMLRRARERCIAMLTSGVRCRSSLAHVRDERVEPADERRRVLRVGGEGHDIREDWLRRRRRRRAGVQYCVEDYERSRGEREETDDIRESSGGELISAICVRQARAALRYGVDGRRVELSEAGGDGAERGAKAATGLRSAEAGGANVGSNVTPSILSQHGTVACCLSRCQRTLASYNWTQNCYTVTSISWCITKAQAEAEEKPVTEMVQPEELTNRMCTTDTDTFLSQILPVAAKDIDSIFHRLTSRNASAAYDGMRWASFPADSDIKKKAHLYAPIAKAANVVLDACRAEPDVTVKMENLYWRFQPDHGKALTSLDDDDCDDDDCDDNDDNTNHDDDDASLIRPRPDIVMSLSNDAEAEAMAANEAKILEHVRNLGENAKISSTQHDELSKTLSMWWLRVHVPVKIECEDSEEDMWAGVDQLCIYMKSVLAEQLDRRFVIGLLVCKYKLTVWLCDRSGLVGTRTPIDIHKEPNKFIHVMMALSCLEPARLGWDPTMKVVCPGTDGPEYHLSTSAQVTVKNFGKTAYETKWAIFLPREDGSAEGEWYVTVRALSLVRAAMMTGRATLVWLVTKAGENE
ncbi:hypothetical protein EVG20_g11017, partial [Dentipellis fragilis]